MIALEARGGPGKERGDSTLHATGHCNLLGFCTVWSMFGFLGVSCVHSLDDDRRPVRMFSPEIG